MNEYVMAHITMYARRSAPLCVDVGGAYGGRWTSMNHVHAHLVGLGVVCRGSIHYAQCYRTWGVGSTATE